METESIRKVSGAGVSPAVEQAGDPTACGCGAPEGIRTPNLLIRSQMLYPLSYGRMCSIILLAEARGFEPPVPGKRTTH